MGQSPCLSPACVVRLYAVLTSWLFFFLSLKQRPFLACE